MTLVQNSTASKLLNTDEVASALNVSEKTVRAMCRSGVIRGMKLPGSRTWKIREDELARLLSGESYQENRVTAS